MIETDSVNPTVCSSLLFHMTTALSNVCRDVQSGLKMVDVVVSYLSIHEIVIKMVDLQDVIINANVLMCLRMGL